MIREIRVWFKLILCRFVLINSFCRECGCDVRDFVAPDHVWRIISPCIKRGDTLCYNCFCDKCAEMGLPSVWILEKEA